MTEIEKLARMAMLFDFYGQLLTKKQQEIMEMFYADDLSLSEIAEECEISRQAVYDLLKRTEKILEGYEAKLRLVDKFTEQNRKIAYIRDLVSLAQKTKDLKLLDRISEIIQEINGGRNLCQRSNGTWHETSGMPGKRSWSGKGSSNSFLTSCRFGSKHD
jgi:predicted DNA-binding protein YlxM (UPF0122 family)